MYENKIENLRDKINCMIVSEAIDIEELLTISQELDKYIVKFVKSQIKLSAREQEHEKRDVESCEKEDYLNILK